MSLAELSNILWHERQLLEMLLFKLSEEQLLLGAGQTRWLPQATREVEMVLEEIRRAELGRAAEVESLARDLGLDASASLRQLAEAVPAPWTSILADHRQAFMDLTHQIAAVAEANRGLVHEGYVRAQEALAWLSEPEPEAPIYSASGTSVNRGAASRLIDREL